MLCSLLKACQFCLLCNYTLKLNQTRDRSCAGQGGRIIRSSTYKTSFTARVHSILQAPKEQNRTTACCLFRRWPKRSQLQSPAKAPA